MVKEQKLETSDATIGIKLEVKIHQEMIINPNMIIYKKPLLLPLTN